MVGCTPQFIPQMIDGVAASLAVALGENAINGFSGHINPSSKLAMMHAFTGQRKDVMPCAGMCLALGMFRRFCQLIIALQQGPRIFHSM